MNFIVPILYEKTRQRQREHPLNIFCSEHQGPDEPIFRDDVAISKILKSVSFCHKLKSAIDLKLSMSEIWAQPSYEKT